MRSTFNIRMPCCVYNVLLLPLMLNKIVNKNVSQFVLRTKHLSSFNTDLVSTTNIQYIYCISEQSPCTLFIYLIKIHLLPNKYNIRSNRNLHFDRRIIVKEQSIEGLRGKYLKRLKHLQNILSRIKSFIKKKLKITWFPSLLRAG